MKELSLSIPGNPIAKKRPRFARRGKFVTTYNAQESEEGKFICIMSSKICGHCPIKAGTPIHLDIQFIMPFPSSMSEKKRQMATHTKKPDIDNLLKFFKDCANGILWHDDSQVVSVNAYKSYGKYPQTTFSVRWEE